MKLWSLHEKGFSITNGRLRHELSDYYNEPNIPHVKQAYAELARRLETDQYLWCYTNRAEIGHWPTTKVLWQLEVPEDRILAYICDSVWNKILGMDNFCPPQSLYFKWKKQALDLAPYDPDKRKEIQKRLKEQYYAPEPENVLWGRLFLDKPTPEDCSALIPFPAKPAWIIPPYPK